MRTGHEPHAGWLQKCSGWAYLAAVVALTVAIGAVMVIAMLEGVEVGA
jgi:hypothetical protein